MAVHAENRARLAAKLLEAGSPANALVVLEGGKTPERDDSDHEPVFRQESWFHWAFGVKEPDCFGAIHVGTGRSILFVPRLDPSYAVWMGKIRDPASFLAEYGVDEVRFVDEIDAAVTAIHPEVVHVNYGQSSDSKNFSRPANFPGKEKWSVNDRLLHPVFSECRVIKSDLELELIRYSNMVSSEAHMQVMAHAQAGMKEYQLESLFKHWCYYYGGCRNMSYTCICASGDNGSVLHYGHAGAPNDKTINKGDMCLFDLGAEYHCYASDITCSFPVSGKFTSDQRAIYEAVLEAQWTVMGMMKPGVAWPDCHRAAYRTILTHLTAFGLLRGDIDAMMAANLGAVFMPHGLGHFLGIDTHDCGGYPAGVERSTLAGFRSLRTGRVLAKNMVLSVEPGVYFNDYTLDAAIADPVQGPFINVAVLDRFRGWGGVRLEDIVRVTDTGMENLTWCPRTVADVEAVCAGRITSRHELFRKFK